MDFSISTIAYDLHQPMDARLREFSAAGFTAIDWTEQYATTDRYTESEMAEVSRLCEKYGMRIPMMHGATHFSLLDQGDLPTRDRLWLELNTASIEFLSRVGGNCVVLHLPNTGHGDLRSEIQSSKRLLDALRPTAERCRVRLALENSPCIVEPGDYWPGNRKLVDALLESYPPEFVGFCFDSGHAHVRNEMGILNERLSRLIAVHLHDNDGKSDQHLLPGQGAIDWHTVISTLKQSGFSGPVNMEVIKPEGVDKARWLAEAYTRISGLWEP